MPLGPLKLKSQNLDKATPLLKGQELNAKVTTTFLRGNRIYDNGEVLGKPKGIYLKRPY
ncbi:MAG: hypothetical protein Ct9H300mP6_06570 [Gammaproteobacteria bacterium]|nr:MAG: hypothetical protein Ct9H300mP6_06570 [Gammaproteobacteria bacterium]